MDGDTRAITKLFETVSLGAPQNAVGFVMWRVMHRYVRAVDRTRGPRDHTQLKFTTLTLLAWMARGGDAATQAELARFGDIHPMQVSNILKTLERKAMVRRTPKPGGGMAKTVAITPLGLTALRGALPLVIAVQRELFGEEGAAGGRLLDALVRIDGAPA
jgi:DNA-binding MarR family transcriptional regulator